MTGGPKTWFITGTSRGFGRVWTEAALARGDRVAATARDPASLDDLHARYGAQILPLRLDVTDRSAAIEAVDRAHEHFGRLDVVVNNAGYGLFGMIEEVSEAQARAQFDTNVFGALWVTQAALPHLRAQGSGHIIQISSIGGITAFPSLALYNASKWALEGMSQALAGEVRDFGIRVTLVEPMPFATDWAGESAHRADPMPDYTPVHAWIAAMFADFAPGQPTDAADALLRLADAGDPPLRCLLGAGAADMVKRELMGRIDEYGHVVS